MKINLFLFLILTSILFHNAVLKVTQTDLNYSISQIETEGDKKINHRLKNELLIKNPKGKNLLVINLTTNKKQVVKEKILKMKL